MALASLVILCCGAPLVAYFEHILQSTKHLFRPSLSPQTEGFQRIKLNTGNFIENSPTRRYLDARKELICVLFRRIQVLVTSCDKRKVLRPINNIVVCQSCLGFPATKEFLSKEYIKPDMAHEWYCPATKLISDKKVLRALSHLQF